MQVTVLQDEPADSLAQNYISPFVRGVEEKRPHLSKATAVISFLFHK